MLIACQIVKLRSLINISSLPLQNPVTSFKYRRNEKLYIICCHHFPNVVKDVASE